MIAHAFRRACLAAGVRQAWAACRADTQRQDPPLPKGHMMSHVAPITPPVAGPSTCDVDEFQLPISGLYADLELGTASLRLPDEFSQCSGLVQLKLLGQWQRALLRYRHAALRRFAQELSSGTPGMDEAQRDTLLRRTCESLRIDLPGETGRLQPHP
jgi:hypothetical protein